MGGSGRSARSTTSAPGRCFVAAGLEAGHRYVEFGCGLGYVTRWATSIGADALGIDLSADQIAEATELAEGKTEFRVGSVYDHGLAPESFDVSYSRWLLMHLNRPVDAMQSIHAALKPGGLMVCEEADMSAIYAEPPSGHHEYVELAFAVGATLGVDYAGGRRLHRWADEAGFEVLSIDAYQPHYLTGEHKGFWSWTYREAGANLVKAGEMTAVPVRRDLRGHARGRRRPIDPGRSRPHASAGGP